VKPGDPPRPALARRAGKNQGRHEHRSISTGELTVENLCFPFVRQGVRLLRQTSGRKDEAMALVTSLPPEGLNAPPWLQFNRDDWGTESGRPQRLDVSYHNDRCRVQSDQRRELLGAHRRVANNLFIPWRSRQPLPRHLTKTDFQAAMAENPRPPALRFVLTKRPTLKKLS